MLASLFIFLGKALYFIFLGKAFCVFSILRRTCSDSSDPGHCKYLQYFGE